MDRAGHIGHPLFVLSGPIYYEFNGEIANNSYVCRIKKCTRFWIPPYVSDGLMTFKMLRARKKRKLFARYWIPPYVLDGLVTFKMLQARKK